MARLVTVKDAESATALQVVAGSKLFQVVVDDELTAKALLQKGSLRRRVTIIPLNKISSQVSSPCRELLVVIVCVESFQGAKRAAFPFFNECRVGM